MSELVYYEKNTYSIQMPESFEGIYLVQLADITAKADWCVESHEQFCHEVLLVFEGELSMRVNERRIRLAAGQMAVIAEGATHEIDPGGSARVRLGVLGIRLNRSAEPRFGAFFSVAPEQIMGYTEWDRENSAYGPEALAALDVWADSADDAYMLPLTLSYTDEESSAYTAIMSDVNVYVNESSIKFINGDRSMDEWDAYVERIERMRIGEATEITAAAYGRWAER